MLENLAKLTAAGVFVIVVAFLGLMLWRTLFSPDEIKKNASNEQPAHSQQQSANKQGSRGNAVSVDKKSTDDVVAEYTGWLAVFTALLVLVSAFQIGFLIIADKTATKTAQAAKESADVAKSTLVASQRAWIRTEIGVGNQPLIFYPKGHPTGASVSVSFKLTNVGNSPATNISYHAWLVLLKNGGPFPAAEQEARCGEIRQQPLGQGYTLFPNEIFPGNIGFGEWSLGIGIGPEEIEKGLVVGGGKNVSLHVVGCVDYAFQTDPGKHHQTGFILELRRKTAPHLLRPEDENIPADELELRESGMGDGRRAD
jgi:hypothetical protein